jgi:hypothetical protein
MTNTEKAELHELGRTPEEIEARRKHVEETILKPNTGIAPAIDPSLRTVLPSAADLDAVAAEQKAAKETAHKRRSDFGTKRGPIVSKEPEAFKIDGEFIVALTAQQITDLNATAGKLLASVGLQPHHLTVSPAEWLLNARVQKHWRTLIGK